MRNIFFLFCAFLLFNQLDSFAQTVTLKYTDQPLNEILLDLNDKYGIQISISSKNSTSCKVTANLTFNSVDAAMNYLAKECHLDVSKIGRVYTFRKSKRKTTTVNPRPKPKRKRAKKKQFLYQGEIVDVKTLEPLPYAAIKTSTSVIYTDDNGRFSFRSIQPREAIRIRSYGYHSEDTLISKGTKLRFKLTPQLQEMEEVVVLAKKPLDATDASTGEFVGNIKLNDISTALIPGSNSNIIFNHLRLYPGVMAAGEVTSESIIWGSYPGQNHVIYDEITLFNSSGMNSDLGRINPFIIKNIEVHKGGYNVHIGDRTGGVMLIDSKAGEQKFGAEFNADNRIASGYLNFPLFNKSSTLQIAGRKSYYQLLDTRELFKQDGQTLFPDYQYGDVNLKLSTLFKNKDRLQISALGSIDRYSKNLDTDEFADYFSANESSSTQIGASAKYTRNWKKGGLSDLVVAYSSFNPDYSTFNKFSFNDTLDQLQEESKSNTLFNNIKEQSTKIIHLFPAINRQQIRLSFGHIFNSYAHNQHNDSLELREVDGFLDRLSFHVLDNISLGKLNVQAGIKADLPLLGNGIFLQPRVTAKIIPANEWAVNLGWGIYNQFISNIPVIDTFNNQSQVWIVNDDNEIPVQQAMHNVLGITYRIQKLELNAEGYYKTFRGLSKFEIQNDSLVLFSKGKGISYGADLFLKWRFKRHQMLFSYSIGEILERYDESDGAQYELAGHSQLHEMKSAFTFNLNPFQVSITGVYGSGFLQDVDNSSSQTRVPYKRVDLALRYTKKINQLNFSTGVSILNLFNTKNQRLYQVTNFPDGSSFSTAGTPFTPTVFLNFKF